MTQAAVGRPGAIGDPSIMDADAVAEALSVDVQTGLSAPEAASRLMQDGPNEPHAAWASACAAGDASACDGNRSAMRARVSGIREADDHLIPTSEQERRGNTEGPSEGAREMGRIAEAGRVRGLSQRTAL